MLQRISYIPKLAVSFIISIVLWVIIGAAMNFSLFFFLGKNRFFSQCDLSQALTSPCVSAITKTLIVLLGLPFLYFILGQMKGISKVVTVIVEHHGAEFVALIRPLIQKALLKAEGKISPEMIGKIKKTNDHLDQEAPWLVRFIFKSIKGDFIHAVAQGQINLKSEADLDRVLLDVLRNSARSRAKRMSVMTFVLFALNAGVFLGFMYL